MVKKKNWLKDALHKPDASSKKGEKISVAKLKKAESTLEAKMKKRATLKKNLRKFKKK